MALAPVRHPQRDFFILDIADVVPKDDTASMSHPLFSLSTSPDMRELRYQNGDDQLRIVPSGMGLPTIFDKDILIFCISQLMHQKNRGEPIGKRVRFSGRDFMLATNRKTGGIEYKRLEDALTRLRGTSFVTNIRTGNKIETHVFGMIEEGGFVRTADEKFRVDYCEVVLSDWIMRAIEAAEIVTISRDYFRIRRPLERRIYEIGRKHCGQQRRWQIGLDKLQQKTGSNAPLKRFRFNLREIITDNATPDYAIALDERDIVTFTPRRALPCIPPGIIAIPPWAEDKARELAQAKGWDYGALEREFREWAASKPEPKKGYGAAFIGFVRKKPELR